MSRRTCDIYRPLLAHAELHRLERGNLRASLNLLAPYSRPTGVSGPKVNKPWEDSLMVR
jgi:hypothetical protein